MFWIYFLLTSSLRTDDLIAKINAASRLKNFHELRTLFTKANSENIIKSDIELEEMYNDFLLLCGDFSTLKTNGAKSAEVRKVELMEKNGEYEKVAQKCIYSPKALSRVLEYYLEHKMFNAIDIQLGKIPYFKHKEFFLKYYSISNIESRNFDRAKESLKTLGQEEFVHKYNRLHTIINKFRKDLPEDKLDNFKQLISRVEGELEFTLFNYKVYEPLLVDALEIILSQGKAVKEYDKYAEKLINLTDSMKHKKNYISWLLSNKNFQCAKEKIKEYSITDREYIDTVDNAIKRHDLLLKEQKEAEKKERSKKKVHDTHKYYKVFGLRPDATNGEIHEQYQKLFKQYTDLARDERKKEESTQKLLKLNEANSVIGSAKKRDEYDRGTYTPTREESGRKTYSPDDDVFAQFFGGQSPFTGRRRYYYSSRRYY